MLGGKFSSVRDWAVLTLVNEDANFASSVDLFSPTINYSGSTQYTASTVKYLAGSWRITTSAGTTNFTGTYDNIQEVIDAFNAVFQENGSGVFTYEQVGPTTFDIIAYSRDYVFVNVRNPAPTTVAFTSAASDVVGGSTITVSSESQITMNELSQEFAYQPYLFLGLNIYADNVAQANKVIQLKTREQSGHKFKRFEYPAVTPQNNQFVVDNVALNYFPTPLNMLNYTMNAGETVRIIISFTGGDVSEIYKVKKALDEDRAVWDGDKLRIAPEGVAQGPLLTNKNSIDMRLAHATNPMMGLIMKHNPTLRPRLKDHLTPIAQNQEVPEDWGRAEFATYDFKVREGGKS